MLTCPFRCSPDERVKGLLTLLKAVTTQRPAYLLMATQALVDIATQGQRSVRPGEALLPGLEPAGALALLLLLASPPLLSSGLAPRLTHQVSVC